MLTSFDFTAAVRMHLEMWQCEEISDNDLDYWFLLVHNVVHFGEGK